MTFYEEYITGETVLLAIEHMFRRRDDLFRLIPSEDDDFLDEHIGKEDDFFLNS